MTKVIYVNWNNRVVVATAKDKEQWVNDWIDDYDPPYNFEEWLENCHDIVEIYEMTAEKKAKLPLRYEEYRKEARELSSKKAEREFSKRFEEIGIEVSGYAE